MSSSPTWLTTAVSTIAKELGVSRQTVYNYLKSSKHLKSDEDEPGWVREHLPDHGDT